MGKSEIAALLNC